jgi:Lipid A 3-O-deacylase (PagL)
MRRSGGDRPPSRRRLRALLPCVVVALSVAAPAMAFDPEPVFRKGVLVVAVEGGGGSQDNLVDSGFSDLELINGGLRLSMIPFGPWFSGAGRGALEVGFEPFFQGYRNPDASFGGLGLLLRYHFLALGRVVPYVELFGAAGGSDLRIPEIDTTFTLMAQGGVGLSVFVSDRIAVYAGYRLQHVSNAHASQRNRGFEAHLGVAGVSFFFP